MKKRLLAVLLALCLALGTLPLSVLAAEFTAELGGKVVTVDTTAKTVKDGDQDVTDYYFIFEDNDTVKYYQGADGGSAQTLTLNALYTVTFNNNDGSEAPAASTAKGNSQKTVSEPAAPAREGYTFSKWTTAADGGNDITFPYTPAADVTLYAQWTKNAAAKITITFTAGEGASVTPASVEIEAGAAIGQLPTPTKEGATFNGWFTAAEGGEEVTAETTFSEAAAIYAQWTENAAKTFTVTFETNGGSAVAAQTVESGKTAAKPADPTKEGSTFGGWFTDADCTAAFDFTKAITANTTVYAKWDAVKTITITFDLNYTGAEKMTVKTAAGTALSAEDMPANPDREGFKFTGWFEKDAQGELTAQPTWKYSADTTVYAKWEGLEGTVETTGTVDADNTVKIDSVTEITDSKQAETLVVSVTTAPAQTKLNLEVSADIMKNVNTAVKLESEVINITIPVEAAPNDGSGKLEVKIDTQAAPASGSTKAAGTVKIEISGVPQAGAEEQLKTPIVFSLNVEVTAAVIPNPVVAYWNAARNAYVRSRGSFRNGKATFSTRHLTEFAVVDASDVQQEVLAVTEKGTGSNAGVYVLAEADESVLAGYSFTYKDGSIGALGATYGGNTVDPETGLTEFAGSMQAPAGGKIAVKTVLAGTGGFEWDDTNGFTFHPANLIAAYGSPDAPEK